MSAPAFKIGEEVYPFPTRFRLGDGVLIKELTGLEWEEFSARFDAVQADPVGVRDYLVMIGMVGCAVWQANPRWTMPRVVAFVNQVDMETFDSLPGDDAVPPAVAAEAPPQRVEGSPISSDASTTSPVLSPEPELV